MSTPRHIYASTLTRRERSWGRSRRRRAALLARTALLTLSAAMTVLAAVAVSRLPI